MPGLPRGSFDRVLMFIGDCTNVEARHAIRPLSESRIGAAYALLSLCAQGDLHGERGGAGARDQPRHASSLGSPGTDPGRARRGEPARRPGGRDRAAARRRGARALGAQPLPGRRPRGEDRGPAGAGRARRDRAGKARRGDHARRCRGARPSRRDERDGGREGDVRDGRAVRRLVLALAAVAALAAPAATSAGGGITVFAAASLAQVFPRIDRAPRYSFAGSDQLAFQLQQGAPADVYAAASPKYPELLYRRGLLRRPQVFATNRLVVLVPRSNPARVRSVYDLTRPGIKIVIGDATVPIGAYTRQILDTLGLEDDILKHVVSEETDVKGIVAKVALGETDAGFVYVTDAKPVASKVKTIALPAWAQPPIRYEIAVVRGTK